MTDTPRTRRAILGISAYYHDSAAVLLMDGKIVAAAQEERFTRKKHDPDFPHHAARYCLAEAGLSPADLDLVDFHGRNLLVDDIWISHGESLSSVVSAHCGA